MFLLLLIAMLKLTQIILMSILFLQTEILFMTHDKVTIHCKSGRHHRGPLQLIVPSKIQLQWYDKLFAGRLQCDLRGLGARGDVAQLCASRCQHEASRQAAVYAGSRLGEAWPLPTKCAHDWLLAWRSCRGLCRGRAKKSQQDFW